MGIISLTIDMVHHQMLKLVIIVIVCSNIMVTSLQGSVVQIDSCNVTSCGTTEIRFPFHLKARDEQHKKNDHCVFSPGFQLSCNSENVTVVEFKYQVNTSVPSVYLAFSVKAYVASIDYRSRDILFFVASQDIRQHYYSSQSYRHNTRDDSDSSFKHFTLNDTIRKFRLYPPYFTEYTFYNCSSTFGGSTSGIFASSIPEYRFIFTEPVASLGPNNSVYAVYSEGDTMEARIKSCTKMYNISDVPYNVGRLTWSRPDCGHCEAKGMYCKFKPNSTILTQCYTKGHPSHKLLLAGKVGGIFFVLLIFVALYYATKSYMQKQKFRSKVETFLEDYKALKPSRYSYADIIKITNQFKVKLGEGGYGSVFRGQLSNDIIVAVKVLNDKVDGKGSGEDFINEVSTIGLIHHVNVVRLVGYCADGCRKALVYEFLPNHSLDKFVYSRKNQNKQFLGWEKMQDIALGIAKGIEYLHQGCDQRILHFDIKPHNILLDENFNPKVADFGLAKLCTKGESLISMTMARGTIGYIAPEVFSRNFGKVSSKSDVYSFGMLLLEMVGARDHASSGTGNTSEAYFPEWVFHQLEQGRETRSQIEEEVDSDIAKRLTIVGLWCINWHPADRPSMKRVIQMLQEEDCPAIPPNPFNSATARNASTFSNTLEAISESD